MQVLSITDSVHTDHQDGDEADDGDDKIRIERRFADKHAVEDEVTETKLDSVLAVAAYINAQPIQHRARGYRH